MLSSAGITSKNSFARALSPFVSASIIFGPGERVQSPFLSALSTVIFILLVLGLSFVAALGVFVRTTIDTWIQFSLYVVPLLSLVCGFSIYRSEGFNTLLERRLSRRMPIGVLTVPEIIWHESNRGPWLRRSALKNCIYPVAGEVYQWIGYLFFHVFFNSNNKFAGVWKERAVILNIDNDMWLVLYVYFWTFGVYITGFVSYSFIFVARLTVRDATSFMCRFGDSPFLPYRPTLEGLARTMTGTSCCLPSVFHYVIGFLSLDMFETSKDIVLIFEKNNRTDKSEEDSQEQKRYQDHKSVVNLDGDSDLEGSVSTLPRTSSISVPRTPKISPSEACKSLSNLIANLDSLASAFQPFIICLSFFSVANFATHIVAIVIKIQNFQDTHWWTFFRTLLWLSLAIRLLWSVASITRILSCIPKHIDYLRSTGSLQGSDEDWEGFFRIMNTYQLRSKTYGFPLTLKQVAYCATFLNFAFLIVLSIMHPTKG